jgi:hypothetical protein
MGSAVAILLVTMSPQAYVFLPGAARQMGPYIDMYFNSSLGPLSGALIDGRTSYGDVAASALVEWNGYLQTREFRADRNATRPVGSQDGVNNVFFSDRVYGMAFGAATAVTLTTRSADGQWIVESDVIFNRLEAWNSYRGPPTRRTPDGRDLVDFRRVALHEFGHVLGLGHPDMAGQRLVAIMNGFSYEEEQVYPDDIAGIHALYGGSMFPTPPPTPTAPVPQAPGQPGVQVNPDGSLVITYEAPALIPGPGASISATFNGTPLPGSPFFIGTSTTIRTAPVAPGVYTIQILLGSTASPPTTFIVTGSSGPSSAPILRAASVVGNTVSLTWDAVNGATGYDIEATSQASGQVFTIPLANQTTLSVPDVPAGSYIVRVRGRSASAVGAYSASITLVVGSVISLGDVQVVLTWNTTADMDLHLIEPDGTHVYWGAPTGVTARLEVDDTDGFGPERVIVPTGAGHSGNYQVYVVHYSGAVPTISSVAVTVNPGTANARAMSFTVQTAGPSSGTGFNVAVVNHGTGQILESRGTRAADRIRTDRTKASQQ